MGHLKVEHQESRNHMRHTIYDIRYTKEVTEIFLKFARFFGLAVVECISCLFVVHSSLFVVKVELISELSELENWQ